MPLDRTPIHGYRRLNDKTSLDYGRSMAREAISYLSPLDSMLLRLR